MVTTTQVKLLQAIDRILLDIRRTEHAIEELQEEFNLRIGKAKAASKANKFGRAVFQESVAKVIIQPEIDRLTRRLNNDLIILTGLIDILATFF